MAVNPYFEILDNPVTVKAKKLSTLELFQKILKCYQDYMLQTNGEDDYNYTRGFIMESKHFIETALQNQTLSELITLLESRYQYYYTSYTDKIATLNTEFMREILFGRAMFAHALKEELLQEVNNDR